jgi:hypothetical protein
MDHFTASLGHLPDNAVLATIAAKNEMFKQYAGEELWSKFQRQSEVLNLAAPSLTNGEIERIQMQRSQVLNPTGIEMLTSPFEFKTTTQFNQELIMSNPELAHLHNRGQIEGYGLTYNPTRNEALWNRVTSGLIVPDSEGNMLHTEYRDDAAQYAKYNQLTALEKQVTMHNVKKAVQHTLNGIDFGSIFSGGM